MVKTAIKQDKYVEMTKFKTAKDNYSIWSIKKYNKYLKATKVTKVRTLSELRK